MFNVDGVIYGNFRCDVSGFDLNRQWRTPHRILHPQIWSLKNHIFYYSQKQQYEMYFDFHGHSKKYNTFCYTCKDGTNFAKIFPLILSKLTPLFAFPDCTYGLDKTK